MTFDLSNFVCDISVRNNCILPPQKKIKKNVVRQYSAQFTLLSLLLLLCSSTQNIILYASCIIVEVEINNSSASIKSI